MGDFLMLDDKGPLLFIQTVTTEAIPKNQTTFDSREAKKRNNTFQEMRKLTNLIEMYQKMRPVLCNLVTDNHEYVGIPYHLDSSFLYFKTQDGKEDKLDLTLLRKIDIIRF